MTPRGRRPAGSPDARHAIIEAARAAFARDGYGTSLRGIAREAGVDAALVHHYFPDRADLFAQSVITVEGGPGLDFRGARERLMQVPSQQLGGEVVRTFLHSWQTAGSERFSALVLAATADTAVQEGMRQFMTETVLYPLARAVAPDRPELRAQLMATQILGIGILRWVFKVDRIASASAEELVSWYGPTIQRYLTGDLPR